MSSYEHALELVDKLTAAGVRAVADPRQAVLPCVLLVPPAIRFDVGCGATGEWQAFALVSGTANAEAWRVLDELIATCAGVLPLERADFVSYALSADSPTVPAYRLTFTEGIDL